MKINKIFIFICDDDRKTCISNFFMVMTKEDPLDEEDMNEVVSIKGYVHSNNISENKGYKINEVMCFFLY